MSGREYPPVSNDDLAKSLARVEGKLDALASEARHELRNQKTYILDVEGQVDVLREQGTNIDLRLTTLERDLKTTVTSIVEDGIVAAQRRMDEQRKSDIRGLFSYKKLVAFAAVLAGAMTGLGQIVSVFT